jgi:hypothetical protein
LLALLIWSSNAADAQPGFEVASVRVADPNVALAPGEFVGVQMLPSGKVVAQRATVFRISGRPNWIKSDQYDISGDGRESRHRRSDEVDGAGAAGGPIPVEAAS